jgi:hypothetical protein
VAWDVPERLSAMSAEGRRQHHELGSYVTLTRGICRLQRRLVPGCCFLQRVFGYDTIEFGRIVMGYVALTSQMLLGMYVPELFSASPQPRAS